MTGPSFKPPDIAPGEQFTDQEAEGDERFWSVTTIIGVLDKPALMFWSAKIAATAAVRRRKTWEAIADEDSTDAAIRWIADFYARNRDMRAGQMGPTERGTVLHSLIEEYTITGRRPKNVEPELLPWLESFDEWAQRNSPVYDAAEVALYNITYGYAGTCDCFLKLDGVPLIGDYKTADDMTTGKEPKPTTPYPEVALQLAAYRHAEIAATWRARRHTKWSSRYYLLSEAEAALANPVPKVDGGVVIHITPNRCAAYAVRCDDEIFDAFLYTQEAARFKFDLANQVIGDIVEVKR